MPGVTRDRNFILQQGLDAPAPEACGILTSALLFQPRVIGVWLLVATAPSSVGLFTALAGTLLWSSLLPSWNPFDALYNRTLGARPDAPRLEPARPPRRGAQALAGVMSAAIAVALSLGATVVALVVQALLLAAVAALVIGRFCFGSFFYHLASGRLDFALRTLPWSRESA